MGLVAQLKWLSRSHSLQQSQSHLLSSNHYPSAIMTITPEVKRQFFAQDGDTIQVIRLPPADVASPVGPNRRAGKPWTKEEHERFLEGLQMFPNGPWRRIAAHVGSRTSRQTMTHAQKYRERISRQLIVRDAESSSSPPTAAAPQPSSIAESHERVHLDELDLQILSSLLADTDAASDDSSSSS
jgi:SHAQKYF class myb-like DNA-binding protein